MGKFMFYPSEQSLCIEAAFMLNDGGRKTTFILIALHTLSAFLLINPGLLLCVL